MRNHDNTWTGGVLLGQNRDGLGDFGNIFGLARINLQVQIGDTWWIYLEIVRLGIGEGFRLIANQVVPIWGARVQLVFEKLGEKWCRKVH